MAAIVPLEKVCVPSNPISALCPVTVAVPLKITLRIRTVADDSEKDMSPLIVTFARRLAVLALASMGEVHVQVPPSRVPPLSVTPAQVAVVFTVSFPPVTMNLPALVMLLTVLVPVVWRMVVAAPLTTTSSPGPGTPDGLQLAAVLQTPPFAGPTHVLVAASAAGHARSTARRVATAWR